MNTTNELNYEGRDFRFRSRQTSQLLRISILAATGLAVLLLSILIGSAVGPVSIPLKETFAAMLHATGWLEHIQIAERNLTIILDIRLPRVIVGALVGAGLSIAGAAMQGVFRKKCLQQLFMMYTAFMPSSANN